MTRARHVALSVLRNYAETSGRAGRSEFWNWTLIQTAIFGGLYALGQITPTVATISVGNLTLIYFLITLSPTVALATRRLHDSNRSSLWLLLGLVPATGPLCLMVLFALPSQKTDNKFGEAPTQTAPKEIPSWATYYTEKGVLKDHAILQTSRLTPQRPEPTKRQKEITSYYQTRVLKLQS